MLIAYRALSKEYRNRLPQRCRSPGTDSPDSHSRTRPLLWNGRESTEGCVVSLSPVSARGVELVGGNDELSVGVAAHAIDRTRRASAKGIRVATRMFGRDGYGTICAANERTFVVEGIVLPEINDKTCVLGTGGEGDGGTDFNAKGLVGLGIRETRVRGRVTASAASYINCAGRRNRPTCIGRSANAFGIRRGANVIFDFLFRFFFRFLAKDEASQDKRQDRQTEDSCEIAIYLHWTPQAVRIGIRERSTGQNLEIANKRLPHT